jgi:hypothetical protein
MVSPASGYQQIGDISDDDTDASSDRRRKTDIDVDNVRAMLDQLCAYSYRQKGSRY